MLPNLQQLASVLYAQTEAPAASGGCAESNPLMLPVIMIAILYVVWILPSQRERKKHGAMLEALKRNDEVITTSGMIGTITDINDKVFTLEIAKGVKIRVLRSAIAKKMEEPAAAPAAGAKPEDKGDGKTSSKEPKAPKA